ncbi:hypothetical protein OPV22_032456 [Ensete ventricosum]|uniref:Phorbol-ester/DAG-type domain-containing protein n=1 Tax=Ensete ventricosum TaxID=4639 RepID=A0AAV8PPL7_ENSVE|nr:hypothetical protein OPV22_032456 [Ensete ventricosum]RWV84480.1 hypothetical protein GW17_00053801 [Ensete ventricosum]RWW76582.1 hypothetical protein BHE74_00015327 [Ensete ventricosum]RZR87108.1 hypothetical protein BHM03_00014424 [Ensete ventricosum]
MKIEKELLHPSHPQHRLKVEYTETPFCCDGCKEAGIGLKYKCDECEFDLHKACALAPPAITHSFYTKCDFRFHVRPPGAATRVCDACGKEVLGFVYHCARCGFDLHPCCANLPQRLDDGDGHQFHLCLKLSGPACHRCGSKGKGWAYRSTCKNYNLHVSCVKELLVESWEAIYLSRDCKNKMTTITTEVIRTRTIPSLRGTMQNYHRVGSVGKVRRCCQIAISALRIIISAILGDPTAIIAAVVGTMMSK